mmetsp:Transcript_10025/g.42147  ORF Transcript_10025/g.42147 Transcript_10025/m.42147 type:complete len:230 (+) Transcript_10025:720-1409(+)
MTTSRTTASGSRCRTKRRPITTTIRWTWGPCTSWRTTPRRFSGPRCSARNTRRACTRGSSGTLAASTGKRPLGWSFTGTGPCTAPPPKPRSFRRTTTARTITRRRRCRPRRNARRLGRRRNPTSAACASGSKSPVGSASRACARTRMARTARASSPCRTSSRRRRNENALTRRGSRSRRCFTRTAWTSRFTATSTSTGGRSPCSTRPWSTAPALHRSRRTANREARCTS